MSFQGLAEAAARRWRGAASIAVLPAIFFAPILPQAGGQARAAADTVAIYAGCRSNLAEKPLGIKWAQDDDEGGNDIAPESIVKYVAVYRDMQRNRSLTVQQAAAKEGMSLAGFRKLEAQIERDDAARQQARDELQAAATASPSTSPPSTDK